MALAMPRLPSEFSKSIYGIHLVGHCGGADLAGLDFLFEVLHRDILPEVTVQVKHDGIDAAQCVEESRQVVVIGNLGGVRLPLYTEPLFQESGCESGPVDIREGHAVGVHVAGGSAELAAHGHGLEQLFLTAQAICEHLYLFAQSCRSGGLSVGACQHGNILPLPGEVLQSANQFLQQRQVNFPDGIVYTHRHTRIIDVLAGEAEVNELLVILQAHGIEFLFQEIFHSLDVMVGDGLYFLDAGGIGNLKVTVNIAELPENRGIHS